MLADVGFIVKVNRQEKVRAQEIHYKNRQWRPWLSLLSDMLRRHSRWHSLTLGLLVLRHRSQRVET